MTIEFNSMKTTDMSFVTGYIRPMSGSIESLSDHHESCKRDGHELNSYVDVDENEINLTDETIAKHGRVAKQQLTKQEMPNISDNGDICIQENQRINWVWTDFWVVQKDNPGSFAVVKNSDGIFAFDQLSNATGTGINQIRFDLEEILSDFPGQWIGGFNERSGRVQSGLLYGDKIEDDIKMGDPFKKTSNKTVIGPKINYRGQELKVKVGVDGWVQIVSPGTYPRDKYLSFLRDVILNYTI